MEITILKDDHSLEALNETMTNKKVILDFYADWCGPCKTFTRTLNSLVSDENLKSVHVIKVDVEKHAGVARQFGIKAMPTLVFLNEGKPVHTKVGAPSETAFKALIEKVYE